MRVVNFNEVLQYGIGEKIPCFRGILAKVYDYNSDTNQHGPWSVQNCELVQPEGGGPKLRVKVWNREPIPKQWVGRVVEVMAVEGDKGIKGVQMEQDTYKWQQGQPIKTQVEVKCGDGAGFYLLEDGGGHQGHQPQNQAQAQRQQPTRAPQPTQRGQQTPPSANAPQGQPARQQQTQTQQQTQPQQSPEERRAAKDEEAAKALFGAIKFAARKVSGFRVVLRAMDKLQEERQAIGKPLSADQFQGMSTSIFIAGDRAFQWDKLPMTNEDLERLWPQSARPDTQTNQPQQ